ncbi:MAG TPA: SDR family oxidoreductase, partial [Tepidisphaeraceae bacterium]|nr:SDR family oxidoreductase [Tepidisphaeraceae bacterium]
MALVAGVSTIIGLPLAKGVLEVGDRKVELDGYNAAHRIVCEAYAHVGASRGIGRAIAVGLAGCGAAVAVHYAGNEAAARDVAAEVARLGCRSCVVAGDLADPAAPQRIFDAAVGQLGRVDVLVLNASVQHRHAWDELPMDVAQQQVQVNLLSTLALVQRFAPPMLDRGWGRIVTLGSVQQVAPSPQMPIYAATKAAQLNLVRNLARDFAPRGVTVNNLAPGVIATDLAADVLADPAWRQRVL